MKGGQGMERGRRVPVQKEGFEVVAATLFGKMVVARYPTLEQAEWRAGQLNAEAERSPRGYLQYLVRPARGTEGRR